jgi:hypothetical protein
LMQGGFGADTVYLVKEHIGITVGRGLRGELIG